MTLKCGEDNECPHCHNDIKCTNEAFAIAISNGVDDGIITPMRWCKEHYHPALHDKHKEYTFWLRYGGGRW